MCEEIQNSGHPGIKEVLKLETLAHCRIQKNSRKQISSQRVHQQQHTANWGPTVLHTSTDSHIAMDGNSATSARRFGQSHEPK